MESFTKEIVTLFSRYVLLFLDHWQLFKINHCLMMYIYQYYCSVWAEKDLVSWVCVLLYFSSDKFWWYRPAWLADILLDWKGCFCKSFFLFACQNHMYYLKNSCSDLWITHWFRHPVYLVLRSLNPTLPFYYFFLYIW